MIHIFYDLSLRCHRDVIWTFSGSRDINNNCSQSFHLKVISKINVHVSANVLPLRCRRDVIWKCWGSEDWYRSFDIKVHAFAKMLHNVSDLSVRCRRNVILTFDDSGDININCFQSFHTKNVEKSVHFFSRKYWFLFSDLSLRCRSDVIRKFWFSREINKVLSQQKITKLPPKITHKVESSLHHAHSSAAVCRPHQLMIWDKMDFGNNLLAILWIRVSDGWIERKKWKTFLIED